MLLKSQNSALLKKPHKVITSEKKYLPTANKTQLKPLFRLYIFISAKVKFSKIQQLILTNTNRLSKLLSLAYPDNLIERENIPSKASNQSFQKRRKSEPLR